MNDSKNIYEITQKKVLEAISLVESSLSDISPYNPEQSHC